MSDVEHVVAKKKKLKRAIRRLVRATEANSWKGAGDPADYDDIEKELALAKASLDKLIEEVVS